MWSVHIHVDALCRQVFLPMTSRKLTTTTKVAQKVVHPGLTVAHRKWRASVQTTVEADIQWNREKRTCPTIYGSVDRDR